MDVSYAQQSVVLCRICGPNPDLDISCGRTNNGEGHTPENSDGKSTVQMTRHLPSSSGGLRELLRPQDVATNANASAAAQM